MENSLLNSDWVAIHICDNAMGIPDTIKDQIFDSFLTTKPIGQGTGIRLSSSYHMITAVHQGKIECYLTVGEGKEFIIQIPMKLYWSHDL